MERGSALSEEKKESLLEGFKAFLMRGNVIDLAVAVVVGAAFTNIVNAVVEGLINPVIGAFGTQDLDKYSLCIQSPCVPGKNGEPAEGVQIMWGSVLSATVSFLITAAVVYFLMVLPMAKYLARKAAREKAAEEEQAEAEATEIVLLREIRDQLVAQRADGSGTVPPQKQPGH